MSSRMLCVMVLSAALVPVAALAHGSRIHSGHRVASCSDLDVNFGDSEAAVRAEETLSVPGSARLELTAARNGGISVQGTDGGNFELTICKVAADANLLGQITRSVDGGRVTINGPSDGDWTAFVLVKAPKGASMGLKAHNGPLSINDVSGSVSLETVNGPLSVDGFQGEMNATAKNGPISLSRTSGDITARGQNGPLSVQLDGDTWEGKGLDASTTNGPVTLSVPPSFRTGVSLQASAHSPVRCRIEACTSRRDLTRDEDEDQKIEFGSGPSVVRLATVNGPVTVRSPE